MAPLADISSRVGTTTTSLLRRTVDVAHALFARQDDEKDCKANPQLCEKPQATSKNTGVIVGASVGGIVLITLAVLVYFHMKRMKRDKAEDINDPFKMSDWGLDDQPAGANNKAPAAKTASAASTER